MRLKIRPEHVFPRREEFQEMFSSVVCCAAQESSLCIEISNVVAYNSGHSMGVCVDFGLSGANPAALMSTKDAGNIFDRLKDAISNPKSMLMKTPAGRAIFKGATLTPTSLPALSLALASAQPEDQTMEM